ncbi:MAG: sugar phosphate isomerase/epimerase [Stenotrophomonas sp.]|uniref:sugar phosphate isomerase/epimerase family protein n=1 Tax=Stenotrophomonas TaxID=40323 RepID=UPI00201D1760|nr:MULTISPECIES: sugar phosphate isomerase/epimerase family protein [Stenotrophomonas]MBN5024786.1 sugar phosphate isomerase/epimerase [Stenotrophomonas maltophilia]MDH1273339.1 sugar phosphate isomerase/epimerase [Stenotrophomonas sp. GD03937]MDH1485725.1 sugar phosphate isomerase/epimerase [Stenotrophomonas sp. GD03712]MDR2958660.1 sugar phosphate isomerase/epimerase [Stenotrophomonas sp.]UQY97727.1 sugar phosphate isomerase/epimerase [Stenotrophomonas maltophilia]
MKTLKGPALFLAQFIGDTAPFDRLDTLAGWAAGLGYSGVQVPTNAPHLFDLAEAARSQTYCDDIAGMLAGHGLQITELSTHLQGQLVAVHPAYDSLFDGFAPADKRGDPEARQAWAVEQLLLAAQASRNLGLSAHATFSGALAWPYFYPWPQRPHGLVEEAFAELGRRWRPILDAFDACGVDLCFEIHPGEDLHDGATFERFLEVVDQHPRAKILYDPSHLLLQQLDYLGFIDRYHDRIGIFHVKDAEYRPSARSGVYGGYQDWIDRPGRFRSLGDGQIDFKAIFSKFAQYDFPGWAVLEWECCLKHPEDGAREGVAFIRDHIIRVTERAFDDFADSGTDTASLHRMLGI